MEKWYELARAEIGIIEGPGIVDNQRVLAYYRDAGFPDIRHDSVPWCAAFVGAMLKRAGIRPSGSLMARSYLDWGLILKKPTEGCIVVLKRGKPPQGHVGFYVSEGKLLGGNQRDRVSITPYEQHNVLGYRYPLIRK